MFSMFLPFSLFPRSGWKFCLKKKNVLQISFQKKKELSFYFFLSFVFFECVFHPFFSLLFSFCVFSLSITLFQKTWKHLFSAFLSYKCLFLPLSFLESFFFQKMFPLFVFVTWVFWIPSYCFSFCLLLKKSWHNLFFLSLALLQSIFIFHYLFLFLLHFSFFDFLSPEGEKKKYWNIFPFLWKKKQEMFFNLYLKLKTFLLKKGVLSSRTNYVFVLSFGIYFLRKRMFFRFLFEQPPFILFLQTSLLPSPFLFLFLSSGLSSPLIFF